FQNYRSAYVKSSPSTFIRNEFALLDSLEYTQIGYISNDFEYKTHYGLYLEYASNFWVEENTFDLDWDTATTIPGYPIHTTGLFVKDAGAADNMVYGNEISNCEYGCMVYDNNRNSSVEDPVGLKIECNDFIDNDYGLDVLTTADTLREDWGIHRSQGVTTLGQVDGESAGNYFLGQVDLDGRNADSLGIFTYNWNGDDTPPSIDLNLDESNINVPLGFEPAHNCPTNVFETRGPVSLSIEDEWNQAQQLKDEYFSLLDCGDTQFLLELIQTPTFDSYSEVIGQLTDCSPYLSGEVLMSILEHQNEIPNNSLLELLGANPHASRSYDVLRKLNLKQEPLSQQGLDSFNALQSQLTHKDQLESRIGYHESRYCNALNRGISELLEDSIVFDKLGAIESSFGIYEALEHRYWRISLAFELGDIQESQRLLDSIPSQFSLIGTKYREYYDFVSVYTILYELSNDDVSILNEEQYATLMAIASKEATRAAGLAQTILNEYGEQTFREKIVEPRKSKYSERQNRTDLRKEEISHNLKIYPNPAFSSIHIELPIQDEVSTLEVYDMKGIQVFDLKVSTSIVEVKCVNWSSGVYMVMLRLANGSIMEQKVEILR
ncbi:MAG: T9SS type A sorting domain-containing protein, partial [Flavobacteriales bacterium]|nr:T9SS type A sorting domain-containing protein [Flavobacteriales bacterium]